MATPSLSDLAFPSTILLGLGFVAAVILIALNGWKVAILEYEREKFLQKKSRSADLPEPVSQYNDLTAKIETLSLSVKRLSETIERYKRREASIEESLVEM